MTSAGDKLRERLAEVNLRAERAGMAVDLAPIRAQIRLLQTHLSQAGSGAGVAQDRVREAVTHFAVAGELESARAAQLVCWGTRLTWRAGEPVLIEDDERFPSLLQQVDGLRSEPRPFRRCWRGLLDSYFGYEPDGSGARNWRLLRNYLHDTRGALQVEGFEPDWVKAVGRHANLLTDDPCRRYGPALLAGESDEVDRLRIDLGIGGASWFTRSLVEAQIDATVDLADGAFKAVLPTTIDLLLANQFSADAGLARLLDRYSRCQTQDVHARLRDFAVERWGNPWLQLNDAKWGRVSEEARRLIADWLKLDFIEKFFSLLSADQMNDERRLKFWRQYHRHIDDMYFALGDTASRNSSTDFKDLRRRMAGRVKTLEQGGTPNNNAFIMTIGGYVFVEFGEKGNALYVFDAAKLPFDLNRGYIAGNWSALKHEAHERRLVHRDSDWHTWEDKYRDAIEELTGITPGAAKRAQPRRESAPPRPAPAPAAAGAKGLPFTDFFSFVAYHKLKFDDLRDKGGALWVYAQLGAGEVGKQLKLWGFTWSDRRGAWYRKTT